MINTVWYHMIIFHSSTITVFFGQINASLVNRRDLKIQSPNGSVGNPVRICKIISNFTFLWIFIFFITNWGMSQTRFLYYFCNYFPVRWLLSFLKQFRHFLVNACALSIPQVLFLIHKQNRNNWNTSHSFISNKYSAVHNVEINLFLQSFLLKWKWKYFVVHATYAHTIMWQIWIIQKMKMRINWACLIVIRSVQLKGQIFMLRSHKSAND